MQEGSYTQGLPCSCFLGLLRLCGKGLYYYDSQKELHRRVWVGSRSGASLGMMQGAAQQDHPGLFLSDPGFRAQGLGFRA